MNKAWKITYYITTVLLTALMGFGAIYDLRVPPDAVEMFAHLGYPAYLMVILSVAKLLGVIGIWQTKWPNLREWAYAGFFFDLAGAGLSSMAVGDSPSMYLPLFAMTIILVLGSYVSMRKVKGVRA